MRVALTIVSTGAVLFLLRVLIALVREGMRLPPSAVRIHFAKFNPSPGRGQLRGQLIEMNLERGRKVPASSAARKAI